MERAGGCLCGAVRFTARLKSDTLGACHCGMCRKWSGGPLIAVQTEGITFGPTETLKTYASSAWAERGFCVACGSSVFYRLTVPGSDPGHVHLAAGALDDLDGLSLTHEVFVDNRPEGYAFAGDLRGMTEAEVMAMFAPK